MLWNFSILMNWTVFAFGTANLFTLYRKKILLGWGTFRNKLTNFGYETFICIANAFLKKFQECSNVRRNLLFKSIHLFIIIFPDLIIWYIKKSQIHALGMLFLCKPVCRFSMLCSLSRQTSMTLRKGRI